MGMIAVILPFILMSDQALRHRRQRMLSAVREAVRDRCGQEKGQWSTRRLLHKWLPITRWLPKYNPKKDLPGDIAAGLTLGIMNIPQGLAYAMLAFLPPITGLYVMLVPVFAYVVLGTSKHLSVGTFAVISIMVGDVIQKRMSEVEISDSLSNSTSAFNVSRPSEMWTAKDKEKIILSATLSLVVGVIQTIMGFAHLGFISIFLSDPLISGFTTGAAFWIFTSQIKHILGIYPDRHSGPFALFKTYISIFQNISDINFASVFIGIVCIALLLLFKHFNEKYKDRLKFPIPAELIVVSLAAGISYAGKLKQTFHIKIVESIPKGLPPVSVPRVDLMPGLFVDALIIAIVAFAISISLAKLFSQKHKYSMDANQELVAYGVQNIVGGYFSCFVSSASLGRSLIQENLGKSQITSVISFAIILLVLTCLAPLFEPLPNAVLAAVIIVAIRRLFKNFLRVKPLWNVNKFDALTWLITWSAVLLFGMDLGLVIGVTFQLLSLIYHLSTAKFSIVGEVRGAVRIYEDVDRYDDATDANGVVIVRFQSPLCFVNSERFKDKLKESVLVKPKWTASESKYIYLKTPYTESLIDDSISQASGSESQNLVEINDNPSLDYIHSIIIDCACFSFIDSVAVSTLSQIASDYKQQDVHVYLVNYSYNVFRALDNGKFFDGDHNVILFPNISEALQHAYKQRRKQIISFMNEPEGASKV